MDKDQQNLRHFMARAAGRAQLAPTIGIMRCRCGSAKCKCKTVVYNTMDWDQVDSMTTRSTPYAVVISNTGGLSAQKRRMMAILGSNA